MTKTSDLLRDIRKKFTKISAIIDIDSRNGYFDSSKFAELLFKPVFKAFLNKEFKPFRKINHPAIDLYSVDERIAIQISSECSAKKIRHTLNMFLTHEFDKKYGKLYIFFLKPYKPKRATLDGILGAPRYTSLVERHVFDPDSLLDPDGLYKAIEDCNTSVIEEIHAHLVNELSRKKTIDGLTPIQIPNYKAVENYIERHLTTSNKHDYWARFFDKNTLFKIIESRTESDNPIRIIIKAG